MYEGVISPSKSVTVRQKRVFGISAAVCVCVSLPKHQPQRQQKRTAAVTKETPKRRRGIKPVREQQGSKCGLLLYSRYEREPQSDRETEIYFYAHAELRFFISCAVDHVLRHERACFACARSGVLASVIASYDTSRRITSRVTT